MLILGIILMLVGAAVAYFGRPREQLFVAAGVVIFLIGVVLVIVWALAAGDVNTNAVLYR
jgi:hypothetical protein